MFPFFSFGQDRDDSDPTWRGLFAAIAFAIGLIWFAFTIVAWTMPSPCYGDPKCIPKPTLVQVFRSQAEFLVDLTHRIW